jgi:hypothetical protein
MTKQQKSKPRKVNNNGEFTQLDITKLDLAIGTSLLVVSAAFVTSGTVQKGILQILFYIISLSSLTIGILFLALCKRRVSSKKHIPFLKRITTLCHRCVGITIGAIILGFPLTIASFAYVPQLNFALSILAIIIGTLLSLPAVSHGLYHGVKKKQFSKNIEIVISLISGFLVALGGYVIFLSMVGLFE